VKISDDLIEDILKAIDQHKELGYRTHSEFIVDVNRRRLDEIKKS